MCEIQLNAILYMQSHAMLNIALSYTENATARGQQKNGVHTMARAKYV